MSVTVCVAESSDKSLARYAGSYIYYVCVCVCVCVYIYTNICIYTTHITTHLGQTLGKMCKLYYYTLGTNHITTDLGQTVSKMCKFGGSAHRDVHRQELRVGIQRRLDCLYQRRIKGRFKHLGLGFRV